MTATPVKGLPSDDGALTAAERATLIELLGTVRAPGTGADGWLPIMTPAVIVGEPQVIDAFWGWIVAYGSQAPEPAE